MSALNNKIPTNPNLKADRVLFQAHTIETHKTKRTKTFPPDTSPTVIFAERVPMLTPVT